MENLAGIGKDYYLKHGLIFGVVGIVYLLIAYLFGIGYMASGWNSFIGLAIIVALQVWMGKEAKASMNGYISFGKAFKAIFLATAIGALLYVLFSLVLNTIIDPNLVERIMDASMAEQVAKLEEQGMTEDQIDNVLAMSDKIMGYMELRYTFAGFIAEYIVTTIMLAIPAFVVAAIIKKEDPTPFSLDE